MSLRMWPPNSKGSGPKIQREPSRCSSRLRLPLALRNCPGRVDEPDMAERLREVSKELPADWTDLLGQQADLIDEGGGTLEHGPGPNGLTCLGQGLGQPEGTQKEGALLTLEAVVGPIAIDQSPLVGEPLLCRVDGGQHPRIVRREKSHQGHHEVGGVKLVRAKGLGEGLGPVTPALGHDRLTDLVSRLRP